MIPIDIQVKVKAILYMLGKGGISVLQTSIFNWYNPRTRAYTQHLHSDVGL